MSSPAIKLLTASVVLCFGCASYAANQTINTDLVVVGAGSAGLSAAVQGAELGKKVVLLEKKSVRRRQLSARRRLVCRRFRMEPLTKRSSDTPTGI